MLWETLMLTLWIDDLMRYFNVKSVEKLPKLIKTHGLPSQEELKRKKD